MYVDRFRKYVPTLASFSGRTNPVVELEYMGKLTKAVLSKDYDFNCGGGTHGHAWKARFEKGFTFNSFAKGVVNYLNDPQEIVSD